MGQSRRGKGKKPNSGPLKKAKKTTEMKDICGNYKEHSPHCRIMCSIWDGPKNECYKNAEARAPEGAPAPKTEG